MKKTENVSWLIAILAASMLILSACKGPDEDIADVRSNLSQTGVSFIGKSFNGVWTVDKQVVDTARLEVTDVFRVRLPEVYLGAACFEKEYVSSAQPHYIEYKGAPAVITFSLHSPYFFIVSVPSCCNRAQWVSSASVPAVPSSGHW